MIKNAGTIAAAGYFAANSSAGGSGPSTLEWNPQELGTSVVRALFNPVGDNSSVTESSGNISSVADLSGNGFDLAGLNNPNWNSGTSTVEADHTSNESLAANIDTAPSTNVGHMFIYAELGATDSFGRYVGGTGQNDSGQSDYVVPMMVNGAGDLSVWGNGSQVVETSKPTGFNLIEIRCESGNTSIWINGSEASTTATGSNLNFEVLSIGRGWNNSYGASINWRCAALVEGTLSTDNRERIEGWMMQQCSDQASLPNGHTYKNTTFSDPSVSANPLTYLDVWREFDAGNQSDFTTSSEASKTWFNSAPNQIATNSGSGNGEEIFSNDTSQHASSVGWEVLANGIQLLGSEIAIKARMYDGTDEDGLNHSSSEDFFMIFVETHQTGVSGDRRKKFNGPGSKTQNNNPKNWKHNDDYSTSSSSFVEASDDSVQLPYGFDPQNGTYMMFACMRDLSNQRYYQWVIELVSGNNVADDMATNDTVTQTTLNGETWYLVSGDVRSDGSNQLEHFFQENTILHKYGYKKMTPSSANFAEADAFVRAYAEQLIPSL